MGKMDPRVIKTRSKLKNAFLQLLSKQKLSEMNVKDLTQTADVTRGTFYLHYKDKETFIQVMMGELISEFFEAVIFEVPVVEDDEDGSKGQPIFSLVQMFDYVSERPDFFTVLLKEKDALPYQVKFSEEMYSVIQRHREAVETRLTSKVPKELIMSFLVYGFLGYIDGWLADGKIYANHFMANNLRKLLASELLIEAGLADFFVTDATELAHQD